MFHNQRKRLLRKERWTADDLAQELWAMFGPDVPLEHRGPLVIYQDGEQPAITFRNFGDDSALFRVSRGGIDTTLTTENVTSPVTAVGVGSSGSNTFPGEITGHISGSNYDVDIYPGGLSGGAISVTVTQLQIRSGATIRVGTWTLVSQTTDGSYYMQVPVWT